MKVKVYTSEKNNSGILVETEEIIDIQKRRWVDRNETSHPMKYDEPIAFKNKNVYYLRLFGNDEPKEKANGKHISLTFCQNQRFLFMQNKHWIQREENIRYIINMLILTGTILVGILNYLK